MFYLKDPPPFERSSTDVSIDTFRKNKGVLIKEQKERILQIKEKAEQLEELLNQEGFSKYSCTIDYYALAMAATNLEQAVMWAVKGLSVTSKLSSDRNKKPKK